MILPYQAIASWAPGAEARAEAQTEPTFTCAQPGGMSFSNGPTRDMKIQDIYDDEIEHQVDIQDAKTEASIRTDGWRFDPQIGTLVFRVMEEDGGRTWFVERHYPAQAANAESLDREVEKARRQLRDAILAHAETGRPRHASAVLLDLLGGQKSKP
jgi:hypothetical protein